MTAPVTKIVANLTRHETVVYFIEGAVDHSCAAQLIESGEYEPDDSNIRHEDVDVVSVEVR
jgi:hypothetical protein